MKPTFSPHEDRQAATARAAFRDFHPEGEAQREREIAALPAVAWRGKVLRTITCTGETGKGPHPVNVPESLLWALIDVRRFRCPYHR